MRKVRNADDERMRRVRNAADPCSGSADAPEDRSGAVAHVHETCDHSLRPDGERRRGDRENSDEEGRVSESLDRSAENENGGRLRDGSDDTAELKDDEAAQEDPLLREEGERSTGEGLERDAGQEVRRAVPADVGQS